MIAQALICNVLVKLINWGNERIFKNHCNVNISSIDLSTIKTMITLLFIDVIFNCLYRACLFEQIRLERNQANSSVRRIVFAVLSAKNVPFWRESHGEFSTDLSCQKVKIEVTQKL